MGRVDAKLRALGLPVTAETKAWAERAGVSDVDPVLEPQGVDPDSPCPFNEIPASSFTPTEKRDRADVLRAEARAGKSGSKLAQKRRMLARVFDSAA